ncbi:TPA: hypothetical protein ACQ31I_001472 [Yersinia enterocolitica]
MAITSELCEFVAKAASQAMLEKKPLWVSGNISEFDQPLLIGLTKLTPNYCLVLLQLIYKKRLGKVLI